MKKKILKWSLIILIMGLIFYVYYYVIGGIIDTKRLSGDAADIKEYLGSFGIWGALVLMVMEALQMVIVFISAEVVQVSAGLAYPIYIVLPLCLCGVFLGASAIYVMTNFLGIKLAAFEKSETRLTKIISRINTNVSITTIMYILFIMPFIPFGAICYFGASSKIKYRQYILVSVTGVIPSVLTSVVLGNTIYNYYGKGSLRFGIAVGTVIVATLLLFSLLLYIVKRRFMFTKGYKKPNAIVYWLIYIAVVPFLKLKYRIKLNKKALGKIKGAAVVIAPHTSFTDFVTLAYAFFPRRLTFVVNRYYAEHPKLKLLLKLFAVIPKSLFYPDIEAIKGIFAARESGNIIAIFPEGRLTTCGESFSPAPGTDKLIKKLGIPLYSVTANGAYVSKPKWAKYRRHGRIFADCRRLATAEEISAMTLSEVDALVAGAISHNDIEASRGFKFRCRDTAKGASGVIFRCPGCGAKYSLTEEKNLLVCEKCGARFKTDAESILSYHRAQAEEIEKNLHSAVLECEADVFVSLDKRGMTSAGSGVCRLDLDRFSFAGTVFGEAESFTIQTEHLTALPFSAGEEFELYHNKRLYYFYPRVNKGICAEFSLFADFAHKEKSSGTKN